MPLHWTIDSKQRLFIGSGEGEVTFPDAMSLLEAMAGARALSYRKLFDGRAVQSTMTADEVLAVCAAIRSCHEQAPAGALAMVGNSRPNGEICAVAWRARVSRSADGNVRQSATGAHVAGPAACAPADVRRTTAACRRATTLTVSVLPTLSATIAQWAHVHACPERHRE